MSPTAQRKKTTLVGSKGVSAYGLKHKGKKTTTVGPASLLMDPQNSSKTVRGFRVALRERAASLGLTVVLFIFRGPDERHAEQ